MARRGENIFRRKDGRWEARVFEHRENGNKIYRSLYGKSYTEVKAKKKNIMAQYIRSQHLPQRNLRHSHIWQNVGCLQSEERSKSLHIHAIIAMCIVTLFRQ